jgi:hypothetical protein
MLRACRAARSGRVLLLAAALLALAGSFGLHPEPLAEEGVPSSAAPEWSTGASTDSATHGCMACLAHRSVSLSGLAVYVPASDATHAAPPAAAVEPVRVFASRTVDGRAPPLPA